MSDIDTTALLKRLAEIEGIDLEQCKYFTQEGGIRPDGKLGCGEGAVRLSDGKPCETHVWYGWDPLTNWADCGPLIEKYKIEVGWWIDHEDWEVEIETDDGGVVVIRNPDLTTAICIAVVEAHK